MKPFRHLLTICLLISTSMIFAQAKDKAYIDSLENSQNNYIQTHDVVKEPDRKFLRFFPIDIAYNINCRFETIKNGKWFEMSTSGKVKKIYRRYGRLTFIIHDTTLHLYIYQSQSLMNDTTFKDYLFIPFTDITSGEESYGGGRYLECFTNDIKNNILSLDFNKAYNPYCAYSNGYNCPIPPKENDLPIAVKAGEKNYGKAH